MNQTSSPCTNSLSPMLEMLNLCRYETAPARDLAMASLAISTIGSVLYAVSPNDICVLASRFIVGVAAGVQGMFVHIVTVDLCGVHVCV